MAKKENVNPAEQYRQERKKRLAQAAKKNSKKSIGGSSKKAGMIIKEIIAALLIIAIVFGVGFFVADKSGAIAKFSIAMTVGNTKITSAEFAYMYYQKYQSFASQAAQYEQYYGSNVLGLDTSKSPKGQESPYKDDSDNVIMWDKYIENETVSWLNEFIVLYKEALANNYKLTDEEKSEIESQIADLTSSAKQNNMSLNAYLYNLYGSGINKNVVEKFMNMEKIVARYQEDKQQGFKDSHTDEALDEEYNKDKDKYDVVSLRIFSLSTTLEQDEGETEEAFTARKEKNSAELKAKAQAVYDATTNVETFLAAAKANAVVEEGKEYDADEETESNRISKESLTSKINDKAAEWAFADERKVGDKAQYETDSGYYVVILTETQYPAQAVNVRHILISFHEDSSDTSDPTEEEKTAAKAKADSIYAEWKKDPTEDNFATLATDNTTDTGSKENGGLYENVTPGQMVRAFDNWCFDRSRKAGDTDIVETTYGYHIMYFSSRSEDYIWRTNLRESLSQDDYSAYFEEALKKDSYKLVKNTKGLAKGTKKGLEIVDMQIAYNNSSSSLSN
ncbi:MAG: peptidyl-prolyl cis-trans isomerase [Clostridiales bacterium]|nr:peptidyl-prolyl cis-trans isomerase [Clostridiales bacterium]